MNRFRFSDAKARYEMKETESNTHHHHLICEFCGKIINYSEFIEREKKLISTLEKKLSKKHGFRLETHQLHFYGTCRECNKKGGV